MQTVLTRFLSDNNELIYKVNNLDLISPFPTQNEICIDEGHTINI